jgi:hypothetical protein
MRSQSLSRREDKRRMNLVPPANEVGARLSTVGGFNTAYDGLVDAVCCPCKPLSAPTVSAMGASLSILKMKAGTSSGEGAWLGFHPFRQRP